MVDSLLKRTESIYELYGDELADLKSDILNHQKGWTKEFRNMVINTHKVFSKIRNAILRSNLGNQIPPPEIIRELCALFADLSSTTDDVYKEMQLAEYLWDIDEQIKSNNASQRRTKKLCPGHIYLIKVGNYYKIGRTNNISSRINKYITENPTKPELITHKEVNYALDSERKTLRHFDEHRHPERTEWFIFNEETLPSVINFINSLI